MSDDCHLYYTDTKLGLTGDVTTEPTWGFPLTLLLSSTVGVGQRQGLYRLLILVTWFALCWRCRLGHLSPERPLVPSAIFRMATRPFSSRAMGMSAGAAQLLVTSP